MNHFNNLSDAESEALTVLAEECAEVIKEVMKIQRHGLYSTHPNETEYNVSKLGNELGDVLSAIKILQWNVQHLSLSSIQLEANCQDKLRTVGRYLRYAEVPR